MIRCLVAWTLLSVVSSCAAQESSINAQASPRLTWAAPVARLELGAAPLGPGIISFSIGTVHNPMQEPISVQLAFAESPNATPVAITTVSLFPSNQPSRFIARVPPASGAEANASNTKRVLIATLIKAVGQSQSHLLLLSDLKAEWIAEPSR